MARHCGKCGKAGHYKSTCTTRKPARKTTTKKPKTRKRGKSTIRSRQGLDPGGAGWIYTLYNTRPGHNKSWAVKVEGAGPGRYAIVTKYGKINGQKNTARKIVGSRAEAEKILQKLIESKFNKGYSTGYTIRETGG